MNFGQGAIVSVGPFRVETTTNGGHPPEFWVERILEKLIQISDTAAPEIRLQAEAYREAIKAVILDGVKRAILSDHTTLAYQLRKAGMDEAASLVLKM